MSCSWQANEYPTLLFQQQRGRLPDIFGWMLSGCCQLPDCNSFLVVSRCLYRSKDGALSSHRIRVHAAQTRLKKWCWTAVSSQFTVAPVCLEPANNAAQRLSIKAAFPCRPLPLFTGGESWAWTGNPVRRNTDMVLHQRPHQSPDRQEADRNRKEEHSGDKWQTSL